MLYITFPLAILVELLAPLALAVWLARRVKAAWLLVGVGVLTFIGSQVVHIPLNWVLSQVGLISQDKARILQTAIVAGLSAGLCEETARAIGYWALKRRARTWQAALTLGAGHGGIESMIVGGLVLLTFVNMIIVRNLDLSTLGISGEQLALAQKQVAEYWAMAWHLPLAGAVERVIAITLHLSLSVLVLQAFTRKNALYYACAVTWHAVVDAIAVILAMNAWGAWAIEGMVALLSLVSLGIIVVFRRSLHDAVPDVEPAVPPPAPPIELKARDEPDALREQIERSKFDT